MDHMDLIAGMEYLSSVCQKLQHSNTGGCPKIALHYRHSTETSRYDQTHALAFLATGRNVTTHSTPQQNLSFPSQTWEIKAQVCYLLSTTNKNRMVNKIS